MGDCIDLTLDSDDEAAPQTSRPAPTKRRLPSPTTDDSDVILVEDGAEAKRARQEPAEQQEPVDPDADVIVTAETGDVALRDYPHSRPDCGTKLFKKGVDAANSITCPQCYCMVCDKSAAECQFWGTGVRARDHCNAHSTSYWEALRKAARKGNKALLEKEFASSAPQLHTGCLNQPAGTASSKCNSTAGMVSPAVLWARAANAAVASSEALLRTPAGSTPAAAAARSSIGSVPVAAAAAAAATAAGGLGSGAVPLATPAAVMKAEVKPNTPAMQTPQVPAASPWLQRMPHPNSVAPQMQHLATLELPVKAVKGLTIADVQRRLVPTGFYKGATGRTPEFGEHLCLDNITGSRYVPSKRKEKADFLQLLPLVPPRGLPAAPSTLRTWKVLVLAHDGSARPQAVAVTVEHDCKLLVLMSALRSKLGQSNIKPSEELLLAQHQEGLDSWRWLRDSTDMRMADSMLRKEERITHYAFKVPKDLLARHDQGNPGYLAYTQPKTRMALVWHEKTLPRENEEQQQQQDRQQRQRQQEERRQRQRWRPMFCDSDDDSRGEYGSEDPDTDEDMDDYVARMLGCGGPSSSSYRRPPEGVRFGLPQLVVVPELHLHGGDAADEAVRKDVIAQLNLFCRAGQEPSANAWPFELNRMSVKTHWQRSQEENMRWAHRSPVELSSQWDSPGIATLYAHWGVDPIAPPPGFGLDEFSAVPQVTDAADLQKLAGMPKVMQDWIDYQTEMKLLSTLPGQVMIELKAACNASPAPTDERYMHSREHKPAAAAVLSIVPANPSSSSAAGSSSNAAAASSASSSAVASAADAAAAMQGKKRKHHSSSRLGVLRIEVYVFKAPGRGHRLVAEDYNDWGVGLTGRQARRASYTSSCILKSVMDARLLQEPDGYQLLRELEMLKQTDCRSIAKLMEWVVTGEREPAQQPAGLNVPLHPYQLQSLAFMQESEKLEGGWRQLLWRWLPPHPQQQQVFAGQQQQAASSVGERGKGMWWSPVLARLSFSVPPAPWGGFLAEEMGLGKTVEVLGLVLSNPAPPSVLAGTLDATGKIVSRATLVVVAVSLVGQWCAEASSKLSGGLKMYPYHGQNRVRDPRKLATQYDLVVTTYATLCSDYGKNGSGTRNPLHQVKWHRVVFDEGHTVKNIGAGHSKACMAVAAERRWVCTGTPLNNDITDLLGQFAVLQMQPLGSKPFFDSRIKPAFTGHGYGVSLVPLLYTLRHSMVRHTKAQTIAGVSVLALPEKTEELVEVVLSPPERRSYLDVHAKAAALWASVRHFSPAAINQKLLQIMALLLPLRRICSGGQLRPSDLTLPAVLEAAATVHGARAAAAAAATAAAGMGMPGGVAGTGVAVPEDFTIAAPEELECPICLDAYEAPVMTPCQHWFCKECILGVLSSNAHCPLCRGDLNPLALRAPGKNNQPTPVLAKKSKGRTRRSSSDGGDSEDSEDELEAVAADSSEDGGRRSRRGSAEDSGMLQCESKLQALIAELTAMRTADPSSKALVFSQYNSTLEWLQRRLPEEGFSFRTITGSMAQRQRARAIEAFQSDPPTTVFLLSMRSGAVGINLTAASHVFLLEPCLNPALEEQAIGRAWRMGQQRKVTVKRFYVKGSIEERIMDVRRIRQGHAAPAAAPAAGCQAGTSAAAAAGAATPATPAAAAAAEDAMDDPITARNKKKVGAAVLAGNLKADRQVLKIAELDLLFRTPELDGHNRDGGSGATAAAAGAGAAAAAAAEAAAAAVDEARNMEH